MALLVKKIRDKIVEKLKSFKESMIWNGVIKSIMLTYLKNFATFYLACMSLKIQGVQFSSAGTLVVTVLLGVPLALFPFWCCLLLFRNKENLQDKNFKKRYGYLYEDLKQDFTRHSSLILLYPSLFSIRRVCYVFLALLNLPSIQFNMFLLILSSIIHFWFMAHVRPLNSTRQFRLEFINELFLLGLCYHLLCFTDLMVVEWQIDGVQPSFQIGIVAIIAINLAALV